MVSEDRHFTFGRRIAVLGVAAALATTGMATGSATTAAAGAAPEGGRQGGGECRLVRLKLPEGWGNGNVMDIEQIGDQVYYYGRGERGEHRRAFVWAGLHADPVRVGPTGFFHDTPLEMTDTGLVNGDSFDRDGTFHVWVHDLATGETTVFDPNSGPRGTDHGGMGVRRINGAGAAAGAISRSDDFLDGAEAVGFESPSSDLTVLPQSAEAYDGSAFGINEAGDRTGYLGREFLVDIPEYLVYEPVIWRADGTVVDMARPAGGLDAVVRNLKDDGSASGLSVRGRNPETAHIEATYWPAPDQIEQLGLVPGGGFSDAFGMDEGGWLVGAMDRLAPRSRFAEEDFIWHSFLRTPTTTPGKVRILPSLYGARHDLRRKQWVGSAVHAVNRDLDQAGAASHWKFNRRGRLLHAPTVYVNASKCGREIATTHTPFWKLDGVARRTAGLDRPSLAQVKARLVAQP